MTTLDTVVVGAGHAGLAVSKLLTDAGRDHVVLDRGRVGERWRTERWDSLHLLTPSWMTRLPGWSYTGPDPDGYLSAGEFVGLLEAYAASFGAPVVEGATVLAVAADRRRSSAATGSSPATAPGTRATSSSRPGRTGRRTCRRAWRASTGVDVVTSNHYRNPDQLGPRRRARRGRVVVRRADRRRAQPGRARRHPRGRPAHPDAAALPRHGHLLVARGRPAAWPGPSTRSPTPRPPARETSLQLVGRNDPDARHPGPRPRRAPGPRRPARRTARRRSTGRRRGSATTWPPPSPPPTRRWTGCSTASTASSTGSAWPARCGTARGPDRSWSLAARAPRPARGGHRHRAGGRGLPPGPPVAAAADHRPRREPPPAPRRHPRRGRLRRRAAVPAPARLRLHRRRPARRARRRGPPARRERGTGTATAGSGTGRQESAA